MIPVIVKQAFRNLLRDKVYSYLIIGGFAIGFAACILIGLFYHTETTVNNDFANHKEIYRLYDVKKNRCNINWNLYPVLLTDFAEVEDACPLDYNISDQMTVKDEETNISADFTHLIATTENFFSIFSVELTGSLSGNPFDGKESMAVSAALAESLFGTLDPVGRKINIGNYFYGTVTSVFKELPVNSSFNADIIINSANEKFRMSTTKTNGMTYNPTNLFIKVREGTQATDLSMVLNRSDKLKALDIDSLALQGLDDIYLSELTIKSRHAKGNPGLLKIFLGIATLILILSSINYLNYTVSVQYARLRTTGIKKVFGAGWKELVHYALVEVSIGIIFSLILAVVITDFAMPYSESLFGKAMYIGWPDLIAVAPVFLVVMVVLILINSLAPIYILSKFNITECLSGFKGKKNRKQLWKHVLLTFQLTVSVALIAVVIIILRQLHYVKHSDPGFDQELLLRIDLPYKYQQTDALRLELANLAFVKSTSLSSGCPGMINHRMDSNFEGRSITFNCIYVGDDYLNTMGMELLEGRDFLDGDLNKSCLINEEAFKQYGWENLEGKRFNNGQEGGFEVIGKIKNFKFESYHNAVEPLALLYAGTGFANVLSVRLSAGNTGQQIDQISKVWKTLSPYEPFSYLFYDDFFQSMYIKEEKLAASITFFTLLAIALTCMGILGQIFMICISRVREIGIRKINGAKISGILYLLNSDFIILFGLAFFIASPVSFYIGKKWLKGFAFKTTLDWWVFVLAGVIALIIISVTVSWQSWRAATRNPVEALRYE